jgi:DNA ligase (NAD+)
MNKKQILQKVIGLTKELNHHAYCYYTLNKPKITDIQYDALYQELLDLEKQYPEFIQPDSPTKRIGDKSDINLGKVTHSFKMGSLMNCFNLDDVNGFFNTFANKYPTIKLDNISLIVQPKFDGLSLELVYRNGKLYKASTRGDGDVGEDVTKNVLVIDSIPKTIDISEEVAVYGEILMFKEVFNSINKQREQAGKQLFLNPRNAAAGSLRQLNPDITRERNLNFIAYGIRYTESNILFNQQKINKILLNNGFDIGIVLNNGECLSYPLSEETLGNVIKQYIEDKDGYPFETDGLVFKYGYDLEEPNLFNKYPDYACAYKVESETAVTKVISIDLQIGMSGVITPVVNVKTVMLSGTSVSRVTGNNQAYLNNLDVRVGDLIRIKKSCEIIPKIVHVVPIESKPRSEPFRMPENCPCCNTKLEQTDTGITRCPNRKCPEVEIKMIEHFASKGCMNIKGLGEKIIRKLYSENYIRTPLDLYRLILDQLTKSLGSDLIGKKIFDEINQSRHREESVLLRSLGIPMIGLMTSKSILIKFGSIENLSNTKMELANIMTNKLIGFETAKEIIKYFSDESNLTYVKNLVKEMRFKKKEVIVNPNPKVFVLTGILSTSRSVLTRKIEDKGHSVSSSVSKKVDYLVCGKSPGSKLDTANKLGVPIITEEELLNLI